MARTGRIRNSHRSRSPWLALAGLGLAACIHPGGAPVACPPDAELEFYRATQAERSAQWAREVARLRADLGQAERTMVSIESGLRGMHTRADAVSSIAEARIAIERASRRAPWRRDEVREARDKLEEAERQLQAGHAGSAVFFASRAARIATTLDEEANEVERNASTRFVNVRRVNLRIGPSVDHRVIGVLTEATPVFPERQEGDWVLVRTVAGPAGWVHTKLLTPR